MGAHQSHGPQGKDTAVSRGEQSLKNGKKDRDQVDRLGRDCQGKGSEKIGRRGEVKENELPKFS